MVLLCLRLVPAIFLLVSGRLPAAVGVPAGRVVYHRPMPAVVVADAFLLVGLAEP